MYFTANAPNEVNVPGTLMATLKKKMEDNAFHSDIFDDMLEALKVNLTDTFSRYVLTNEYKMLKRTNTAMNLKLKGAFEG